MNDDRPMSDTEAYVRCTARFLALPLGEEQVARVATHLARTRALAESLMALPLPPGLEPAEVYCPAPFPAPFPATFPAPAPAGDV